MQGYDPEQLPVGRGIERLWQLIKIETAIGFSRPLQGCAYGGWLPGCAWIVRAGLVFCGNCWLDSLGQGVEDKLLVDCTILLQGIKTMGCGVDQIVFFIILGHKASASATKRGGAEQ